MRFIDLRRKNGDSFYDAVIRLGCGPNYVRNRYALFEQMIEEQGKEFWFRFWLSFCLQNDIQEVEQFSEALPIITTSLSQLLHNRFVQASADAAISYCWNVVFEKPTPVGVTEIVLSDGQFIEETYQFTVVNFACALGEVFYKWLRAKEVCNARVEYWATPKKYFEPDFTPGPLEKFMIKHWGKKLVEYLDVSRNQVPWIRKYLLSKERQASLECRGKYLYANTDCLKNKTVARKLKTWAMRVKKLRKQIKAVDEKQILLRASVKDDMNDLNNGMNKKAVKWEVEPYREMEKKTQRMITQCEAPQVDKKSMRSSDKLKKKSEQAPTRRKKSNKFLDAGTNTEASQYMQDNSTITEVVINPPSPPRTGDQTLFDRSGRKLRKCSACNTCSPTKMKKCPQCVEEKWPNPRYYCNIVCQTRDWFDKHEKEHYIYIKNLSNTSEKQANKPPSRQNASETDTTYNDVSVI